MGALRTFGSVPQGICSRPIAASTGPGDECRNCSVTHTNLFCFRCPCLITENKQQSSKCLGLLNNLILSQLWKRCVVF